MICNSKRITVASALCVMIFLSSVLHAQIVQISIPKAGTHLLEKCLHILTSQKGVWYRYPKDWNMNAAFLPSIDFLSASTQLKKRYFLKTHMLYAASYASHIDNPSIQPFFIYRDPRDAAVSLAFYMTRPEASASDWPAVHGMPFDELLLDIITHGTTFNEFPPIQGGICDLYSLYLNWLREPHVLSVRFEDLVGKKGGGSDAVQLATIMKIAQHLNQPLTLPESREVAQKLFGNTNTFRQGKIGSWKKYFKQCHVTAFKKHSGNLLQKLKYEKDTNWGMNQPA